MSGIIPQRLQGESMIRDADGNVRARVAVGAKRLLCVQNKNCWMSFPMDSLLIANDREQAVR
jgi:hypothetical protein